MVRSLFKGIMPYKAFKRDNQYCVYKLDNGDNPTGKSLGCHPTRDKANKQVAALYASEKKEIDMDEKAKINYAEREKLPDSAFALVYKKDGKKVRKYIISDASHVRNALARASQQNDEDAKKAMPKILSAAKKFGIKVSKKEIDMEEDEMDEKELYADYHGEVHDTNDYVPWGVTSFEKYDEVKAAREVAEETKKDVKAFKQMVDYAIEDKNIEDSPSIIVRLAKELGTRISKRTSSIYSLFNKPSGDMPKEKNEYSFDRPLMVFKDKDGSLKWIARYSNIYRDQDNPPEIISTKSHEYFEEMVDKGIAPMPELWIWHMPLRIGEAEVVTFDKENGVAIAMGKFDENDAAKEFAQLVMDNPDDWGVSHGMPGQFIERSKEDQTVITKHITKEISVLPKHAAANKWADFQVLKEVDMTIKQEKLEQLKAHGASDEMLQDLESGNKELATALEELGIEKKEVTEEATEEKEAEVVEAETKEEAEVDETTKEADETEQKETDEVDLQKQMIDAIKEIGTVLKEFNDRIVQLEEKQVEDEKKETTIPEDLPPMALKEFLFQSMNFKENSARESDDTVIDGRTKLAQAKPAEKETTSRPRVVETGNPLLNDVISSVVLGNEQPA